MRRGTIAALALAATSLVGTACAFDTEGESGSAASLGPTMGGPDTEGTENITHSPSTTRDSGALTTGMTSETDGTGDVGSSDSGEPVSTTGPTNPGAAFLTLSTKQVNFTTVQNTDPVNYEVVITNDGMQAATEMNLAVLTATFNMVGGYPGAGGNCGITLEAGESCIVGITSSPTTIGLSIGRFSIAYFDGVLNRSTTEIPVRAAVEGTTQNLLQNPSAATGSVAPWQKGQLERAWAADADAASEDDSYSFRPAGVSTLVRTLRQEVPLAAFDAVNSNAALSYTVSLHAKRTEADDSYAARVSVAGGDWTTIGSGSDTAWEMITTTGQLPEGSVPSIGLEFRCVTPWEEILGGYCGTRFDHASITLSYP